MRTDDLLKKLLRGQQLDEAESFHFFTQIFLGKTQNYHVKAVLLIMAKRGESIDEISGCVKALTHLERPKSIGVPGLMDTCGTGGDNSHSINISTLSAIVIAGAGGRVAKHGNRGISSRCGSSDLMEALGVKLDASPKAMINAIKRFGIGYFHAPYYHPVFSKLQPLRRSLKTRTIFNLIGPLVNPLQIDRQVLGVANQKMLPIYAKVLRKKRKLAAICHGRDGLDEISLSSPTETIWLKNGKLKASVISPLKLGFRQAKKHSLVGGDIKTNKKIALQLLTGKLRNQSIHDCIILNAGVGLVVSGKAKKIQQGIALAAESLDSGKAFAALKGLIKTSREKV